MVNIFLRIIRKGIPLEFRLGSVSRRLRPDIKRDSLLLQYTMGQRKIVSGVRCGCLNGEDIPMDLLQVVQVWHGIMHISRCHCHAQDHTVVRVQGLVAQVIF